MTSAQSKGLRDEAGFEEDHWQGQPEQIAGARPLVLKNLHAM